MAEREVTPEEQYECVLTAIALVRAQLQNDEAAFRALVLDADPWLLVVMLSKLGAELLEASVGDEWPEAMAMLAQFAVERAPR